MINRFCPSSVWDWFLHLQLKWPKGLNDIAENEQDVAHAQGAQQGVEQGRH